MNNNSILYLAYIGYSIYFVTLGEKNFVIHTGYEDKVFERLESLGYKWEKIVRIEFTNIY